MVTENLGPREGYLFVEIRILFSSSSSINTTAPDSKMFAAELSVRGESSPQVDLQLNRGRLITDHSQTIADIVAQRRGKFSEQGAHKNNPLYNPGQLLNEVRSLEKRINRV